MSEPIKIEPLAAGPCQLRHSKINILRPLFPSPRLYKGICQRCGFMEWIVTSKESGDELVKR